MNFDKYIQEKIVTSNFFSENNNFCDKKIVFTNGCFDVVHYGHVRCLMQARELGDILVVGLNSDESVKRLKGSNRPINGEKERAFLLSSFAFVDFVVIFNEDTPENLIKEVKPNILVKGGDYKISDIVGADFVLANGGEVVTMPFVDGFSSTNIIKRANF